MLKQVKDQIAALVMAFKLLVGPKTDLYEFAAEWLSTYTPEEHAELNLELTYKNMTLFESYLRSFEERNMSKVDVCIFLHVVDKDRPRMINAFEASMRPTLDHIGVLLARHKE